MFFHHTYLSLPLGQIENLRFTFDGQNETFSFAEAALLIQGTACIYSKKVSEGHARVQRHAPNALKDSIVMC